MDGVTSNVQTQLDAKLDSTGAQAALHVDHLITLSGVAQASDNLGTFSGSTISDNQTIKAALQALETAHEAAAAVTQTAGTFTATFRGATAEPGTPLTATGHYLKVGKMVTVTIATGDQDWSSYSGVATVTGLPETAKSGTEFIGTVHSDGALNTGVNDGIIAKIDGGGTTIDFLAQEQGGQLSFASSPGTSDEINITITYFTA